MLPPLPHIHTHGHMHIHPGIFPLLKQIYLVTQIQIMGNALSFMYEHKHTQFSQRQQSTLIQYIHIYVAQWLVMASNFYLADMPHVGLLVMKPVSRFALQQHSQLQQVSWALLLNSPQWKMTRTDRVAWQPCSVILSHHSNFSISLAEHRGIHRGGDFATLLMPACNLLWSEWKQISDANLSYWDFVKLAILMIQKKEKRNEKENKRQVLLCLVSRLKDFSTCWIWKRSLISQLLGDVFVNVGVCRSVNSVSCVYVHVCVSVCCHWQHHVHVFVLDVSLDSQ